MSSPPPAASPGSLSSPPWGAFDGLDLDAAAALLEGRVKRTPLLRLPQDDERLDLRGKLENRQETNSFKARGALFNVLSLTTAEKAAGVIAASSGNHGRALAWAARRAGCQRPS